MAQNNPDARAHSYAPPADPGATVLRFGKHAGRTLRYLAQHEPGYLAWLLKEVTGGIRPALEEYAGTPEAATAIATVRRRKARKAGNGIRPANPIDAWADR